jgi:hypothetical protein
VNHAKWPQSNIGSVNGDAKIATARWAGNPAVHPRPRLATVEQAASYLALGTPEEPTSKRPGVRSVWRLIERRKLTPIRLDGVRRTFVEWAELDRLVDQAREDGRP